MLNVAIVDDELKERDTLESYLNKFSIEKSVNFHVIKYDNAINFLTNYNSSYDIVFLDIELPFLNGMEAARKLREIDSVVPLIFVTNMAQYAVKGYDVDADDFIVKPVLYQDFALKLERLLFKIEVKDDIKIMVNTDGEVRYIPIQNVRYVEVEKHNLIYHTIDENFKTRGSLKKVESLMLENYFSKCNNYCLVNLRYVTGVKGHILSVSFGRGAKEAHDEVPISQPRRKRFIKDLNSYLGEKV